MKTHTQILRFLALLPILAAATMSFADVVYDNSTLRSNPQRFGDSDFEFGEEIVLAGNGTYTVTNFQYEFFGFGPDFTNGNVMVKLRFYENNGASGTPGTLLYDSGFYPIPATGPAGNVLEYAGLNTVVPKNFTWTVEFVGLSIQSGVGLQSAGLDLYSFPTVGQTYDDYWERSGPDATWVLRSPNPGQPPINFGCRVAGTYVGPPAITQQPKGVDACPGDTVMFSTVAIGTPPLSYQWFKDGNPIMGATLSNLTINNVGPSDVADYTVRVTNSAGMVTSDPAHLSVKSINPMPGVIVYDNSSTRENPPRFAEDDFEFGDEIILAGNGTWTLTNFKFEYFGYGDDFTNGNVQVALRFYRNDGVDGAPNTLLYDSGFFTVPPTPPAGKVLEYSGLSVVVPQHLTWTVEFIGIGPTSTGGVQAGGLDLYGPPTIGNSYDDYWERSGPGLTWVLRGPEVGQPPINFGARAVATVTGSPYIIEQPKNTVVCRGDSASLSVYAIGSSALSYQWLHNGNPVPNGTNSTLVIPMVDASETGNYTVLVSSCLGSTMSQPASVGVFSLAQSSPCLHIKKGTTDGTAVITWTSFYGSQWILQETPTLNPPGPPFAWMDSAYSPTLIDGVYTVIVPDTDPMRFFRLRGP